jgi:hypothetical protein
MYNILSCDMLRRMSNGQCILMKTFINNIIYDLKIHYLFPVFVITSGSFI